MMQVFGRSARYIRAIHILCAPTSEIAMSSAPSTSRRSQTIFCGLTGKPWSLANPRAVLDDRLADDLERHHFLRPRLQGNARATKSRCRRGRPRPRRNARRPRPGARRCGRSSCRCPDSTCPGGTRPCRSRRRSPHRPFECEPREVARLEPDRAERKARSKTEPRPWP